MVGIFLCELVKKKRKRQLVLLSCWPILGNRGPGAEKWWLVISHVFVLRVCPCMSIQALILFLKASIAGWFISDRQSVDHTNAEPMSSVRVWPFYGVVYGVQQQLTAAISKWGKKVQFLARILYTIQVQYHCVLENETVQCMCATMLSYARFPWRWNQSPLKSACLLTPFCKLAEGSQWGLQISVIFGFSGPWKCVC